MHTIGAPRSDNEGHVAVLTNGRLIGRQLLQSINSLPGCRFKLRSDFVTNLFIC